MKIDFKATTFKAPNPVDLATAQHSHVVTRSEVGEELLGRQRKQRAGFSEIRRPVGCLDHPLVQWRVGSEIGKHVCEVLVFEASEKSISHRIAGDVHILTQLTRAEFGALVDDQKAISRDLRKIARFESMEQKSHARRTRSANGAREFFPRDPHEGLHVRFVIHVSFPLGRDVMDLMSYVMRLTLCSLPHRTSAGVNMP
ncbi:hypothetical protein EVC45_36140 [Paraburkholderia sp. UYCP14C]|uniref:hypothetical protein n=1 Tax=Paraburkholderia sp. UYCP14C TaxID=2511130 RepID=UPI0010214FD2|nr:hypothetical protein [Paraburkholderia sp. UYCP14C]RZF24911.1 hypothetical protein EVC45_36140 [Paraburkholderia sp. UYCP14C]